MSRNRKLQFAVKMNINLYCYLDILVAEVNQLLEGTSRKDERLGNALKRL